MASAGFCVTIHPEVCQLDAELVPYGGAARFRDDGDEYEDGDDDEGRSDDGAGASAVGGQLKAALWDGARWVPTQVPG